MNNHENLFSGIAYLKSKLDIKQEKKYNINLLERVAARLVSFSEECSECEELCGILYNQVSNTNMDYKEYSLILKKCTDHLQKKHKLVSADTYTGMYMCLGVALGTSFGILMDNLALGMGLGVGVGIVIGASMDADAKKKGLII